MIGMSSVMPTAVMMLSIENTISSRMIWPIADGEAELRGLAVEQVGAGIGIDIVMDFLGRLPDQEQAAGDQDQVAPGEAVTEQREDRRGELHDQRDRCRAGRAA